MTAVTPLRPRTAVITIVSGRHDHLCNQYAGLLQSSTAVDDYVVVAMQDPALSCWQPSGNPSPRVLQIEQVSASSALPLAAARNLGARAAIDAGAELLIFLDVDCVPSPGLVDSYAEAFRTHPEAILSGAVGYLPPGVSLTDPDAIASSAQFHAFRARLPAGDVEAADPRLFWSLSFALASSTWQHIGGFHEEYTGYGAEDTDFAQIALSAKVPFFWVGGAEAFHQHHDSEDPPVNHIDDIMANGALFAERWGFWPMEGWLDAFRDLGLTDRDPLTGTWKRTEPDQ